MVRTMSYRPAAKLFWLLPLVLLLTGHADRQSPVELTVRAQASLERLGEPGAIVGAAESNRGALYILDARARITIVNRQLRRVGAFGQQPGGSLAFREPLAIGVLSDGRVAVLDGARQAITLLRSTPGNASLLPVDTVIIGAAAQGMCILSDDKFLIYGARRGMRMHVYSAGGTLERSFAPADSGLPAAAQDQLAMGEVACPRGRDEVLVSSAFSPVVEAFRISTGQQLWGDTLRPYRPATITIRNQGMSIRTPREGHSVVVAALGVGGCRLFQTAFRGRQDGVSADTVVSHLYRNGEATAFLHLPRLVPVGNNKALSVSTNQSALQLVDVRLTGCAAADPDDRE